MPEPIKKLIRRLRGGPLDGTTYQLDATPLNLDAGFVLGNFPEGDDQDTTMVYLLAERRIEGDTETCYFDYFKSMFNAEALAYVQKVTAHHRN